MSEFDLQLEQLMGGRPKSDGAATWMVMRTMVHRYWLVFKRRWWIPLLTISLGLGVGSWFAAQLPEAFVTEARMMVSGRMNIQDGIVYSEELSNFFGTQTELMLSGEVQMRARERVHVAEPEWIPQPVHLSVVQLPKTSLFQLSGVSSDGAYARAYVDAVMEEYIAAKHEMRSAKSESTFRALSKELADIEHELRDAREKMLKFQAENSLGYLKEEGNSAGAYLININKKLADLKTEYELLDALSLDQTLDRTPVAGEAAANAAAAENSAMNLGPMGDYLRAKQQVQMLQAERDQLSQFMRPKHPDIIRLDREIGTAKQMLEGYRRQSVEQIQSRRDALHLQMVNLEKAAKEWDLKATTLSHKLAEYDRLRANVDSLQAISDRLSANLRNVDLSKAVDQDVISILEHASPPRSIRPGLIKLLSMGLGAGLAAGLGILFLLERLDDRLASVVDVHKHFREKILAQIIQQKSDGQLQLLQPMDDRYNYVEGFRALRSSLVLVPSSETAPRLILITSAIPGEGKSTTAANLAIVLAASGGRTLLVDGDLRRGTLHRAFGVNNRTGFAEVLQDEIPWTEAVAATDRPNLSILPRGGSMQQHGEFLLSPTASRFWKESREAYDYVVLDSAPVMVAEDTAGVIAKMDAIAVVVRFGVSSISLSKRTVARIHDRQGKIAGLVLNEISPSMPEYRYYHYGQGYYGDEPPLPDKPAVRARLQETPYDE